MPVQVHHAAGVSEQPTLHTALKLATSKLRPLMDRKAPRSAYAPGGQGAGPVRIKTERGTALATCTIGARTTNRNRAGRQPNEQLPYIKCSFTPQGKSQLRREKAKTGR